jgi:integrase
MGKLTARSAAAATKPGRHGDGQGLYLSVDSTGRRRWVYLHTYAGRIKEMGLGPFPAVPLAEARIERDRWAGVLRAGGDPIATRKGEATAVPSFGTMADEVIEAKKLEWRNPKHTRQWVVALTTHAAALRARPVNEIETDDVLACLRAHWLERPQTASRLRARIEYVLDAAGAKGLRTGPNPARWRGHLDKLLAKRATLVQHHKAMPYEEVAAFFVDLRKRGGMAALALEFAILTAARSGEARGARWDEIDLAAAVWTLPPQRMKSGREHRVALSEAAASILRKLAAVRRSEFVFPGVKADRPLSERALAMLLLRMRIDATTHGFRSSFRDWCGNETNFPREIAESALAHAVGDAVERA